MCPAVPLSDAERSQLSPSRPGERVPYCVPSRGTRAGHHPGPGLCDQQGRLDAGLGLRHPGLACGCQGGRQEAHPAPAPGTGKPLGQAARTSPLSRKEGRSVHSCGDKAGHGAL